MYDFYNIPVIFKKQNTSNASDFGNLIQQLKYK